MTAVPKELKFLLFGMGPKFHATVAQVLGFLGLACLILGIISGAMDRVLGLAPTNWFLVTIVLLIWALWSWLTAYVAAKE